MKIKIERLNENTIIWCIFLIYTYFMFIFTEILSNVVYKGSIFFILLLLTLALNRRVHLTKEKVVWGIFLLAIIWNCIDYSFAVWLPYFFGIAMLIFGYFDDSQANVQFKLLTHMSILYSISVIFQYLVPSVFANYLFPLFSEKRNIYLAKTIEQGYYAGINWQVGFTAFYIIIGIGIIFILNDYRLRLNSLFMLAVLGVGLIITNKRSHLLYVCMALVIVYVISSKNKKIISNSIKIGIVGAVVLVVGWIIINKYQHITLFGRILETVQQIQMGEDYTTGRTTLHEYAWQLFLKNKWDGIGWGVFSKLNVLLSSSGSGLMVHNVFLQLLCETGLVGGSLFILAVVMLFLKTVFSLRKIVDIESKRKQINSLKVSIYIQILFICFCISGNALYDHCFLFMYCYAGAMALSTDISIGRERALNDGERKEEE